MLDKVLQQAGCQLQDMDALAFGRGPGAFTGVRIATSVIQAMAFGSDIQVASVSSLAALAQGIHRLTGKTELLVANDARMNEVYLGAYQYQDDFMTLQGQEKVIAPSLLEQEFNPILATSSNYFAAGTGWSAYPDILQRYLQNNMITQLEPELLPHAQDIAQLAIQQVMQNQLLPAEQVVPIYLRDNVAKKSTKIPK